MKYKPKTQKWFTDRIGKRIYRDDQGCKCETCADVLKNGLIILGQEHAEHLYYTDSDFAYEGVESNYRDTL